MNSEQLSGSGKQGIGGEMVTSPKRYEGFAYRTDRPARQSQRIECEEYIYAVLCRANLPRAETSHIGCVAAGAMWGRSFLGRLHTPPKPAAPVADPNLPWLRGSWRR